MNTEDVRRVKRIHIMPSVILHGVNQGFRYVTDLPLDAVAQAVTYLPDLDLFSVKVWSESFEVVPEGFEIPLIRVRCEKRI